MPKKNDDCLPPPSAEQVAAWKASAASAPEFQQEKLAFKVAELEASGFTHVQALVEALSQLYGAESDTDANRLFTTVEADDQ